MSTIGTPAWQLTSSCIWNAFRSSGKRHLILTGGRGTGKTTLLSRLFPEIQPGITTWAVPGQGVYLKSNRTGETVPIGVFDPNLPGTENKMRPLASGLDTLGVQTLETCAREQSPWATIDEIGYLDTASEAYCAALLALMEVKSVAAVVRSQPLPFLRGLLSRSDVFVVDLDAPFGNLGCVIMASGLGKRFGGNKLMAPFRGKPLVQWALEATDGIFSRRVVVTRHVDVQTLCAQLGAQAVLHNQPLRSDTVRLGLEALGNTLDGCLFCPGDQPLLRKETVAALALCAKNDSAIWRAASGETAGSPVLFPSRCFPALRTLPSGKGGGYVIRCSQEPIKTVQAKPEELRDIDTREALEELEALP